MEMISILEEINECNEIIYGEKYLFIKNVDTNGDEFDVYRSIIPNNDFIIDVGGNVNDFFGIESIKNNQYMFSDILEKDNQIVFSNQHDVNILYFDKKNYKVGACISNDEIHIITDNLTIFFYSILAIQRTIIFKYNTNSCALSGAYKDGFIEDVRIILKEKNIYDIDYFISFFYE